MPNLDVLQLVEERVSPIKSRNNNFDLPIIRASVKDHKFRILTDTGASVSLMSNSFFTQIKNENFKEFNVSIQVKAVSGMNPIEHVWDALGRRVPGRQPPPRTLQELERALLEEWDRIPQLVINSLIDSIPQRCSTLLGVCGNHTPY
ncbi:transposable element Tcb2 transposase [Trichonephila clavipes]|nr:transposable element Tcb2 transposase [Trichonephila clavipes]